MTVKDLREYLKSVPDETLVAVLAYGNSLQSSNFDLASIQETVAVQSTNGQLTEYFIDGQTYNGNPKKDKIVKVLIFS